MFAYELHRIHHAELLHEAAAARLSHEAGVAAKARRRAGKHEPERRVNGDRDRFARAA